MTDMPTSDTSPPPAGSTTKTPGCRRKKIVCLVFTIFMVLAAAGLVALNFCPWLLQLRPGMMAQYQTSSRYDEQLAQMDTRIKSLEGKVQELDARPIVAEAPAATKAETAPTHAAADTARMQSDLVALSSAVNLMQAEIKQMNSASTQERASAQRILAAAIAFIQLRESALSNRSFSSELAAMRTSVGGDPAFQDALTRMEPYAANGAPLLSRLHEELITHEGAAINSIERAQAQNWWQRIVAKLKGLVSVRPLHGGEQSDAFASVETALAKDDANAAMDAFKNLPLEAQQSLSDWHAELEARTAINDTLHMMAAHFTVSAPATPDATP